MTIIVGITGASGSLIASKTIDELLDRDIPTSVVASGPAKMVWKQEMQETFGEAQERWSDSKNFTNYAIGDFSAPIASGSFPSQGMVIVPYLALAPTIVTGAITLGFVQQITRAFGRVEGSLQYLVKSWSTIVELISVWKRLREFEAKLNLSSELNPKIS